MRLPSRPSALRARRCACACGFALAALALLPSGIAAQAIRGVVVEGTTSVPIPGATVELLAADSTPLRTVTSDRRGWFQLDVAAGGRYFLRPRHPSYTAVSLDSVRVGEHEIVTVMLRMGISAIPLEPLVVTARSRDRLAGFYRRAEENRRGQFIHREFIDRRIALRPSQLVRMTPGVFVIPTDNGLSSIITMRGVTGGRCAAAIFLDGLPVPQEVGMTIDDFTAADQLEGIEIYDAYTIPPPELPATTNECGIVAFWSRRDAFRPFTWKRVIAGVVLGAFILLTTR